MTEAHLYTLSQHLRLLARVGVQVDSQGKLLAGNIDRRVEHCRELLLAALEHLQDAGSLTPADQEHVRLATQIVDINRPLIRALRYQIRTP